MVFNILLLKTVHFSNVSGHKFSFFTFDRHDFFGMRMPPSPTNSVVGEDPIRHINVNRRHTSRLRFIATMNHPSVIARRGGALSPPVFHHSALFPVGAGVPDRPHNNKKTPRSQVGTGCLSTNKLISVLPLRQLLPTLPS